MAETDAQDPPLPYPPSAGRLLNFAAKAANDLADKRLAAHDLTLPQWVLLSALWRRDGLTVGELAAYCRASEPTTSSLIDRIERKGLVKRKHDPKDRRQVRVFLSKTGQSQSGLISFYEEINDALLDGFGADERQAFISMMERVAANAAGET